MNSVGVLMRSAWRNGSEIFSQGSMFCQGRPISSQYCVTYWSTPNSAKILPSPAPETAAFSRGSRAIRKSVRMPP
jgi:hypothetical protein